MSKFIFKLLIFSAALAFYSCSSSEEMTRYIDRQANPFFLKKAKYVLFSKLEGSHPQVYFGLQLARNEFAYTQDDSGFTANIDISLSVKKNEFETVWDTVCSFSKHFYSFDSTRITASENILIPLNIPQGEFSLSCIVSEKNAGENIRIFSDFKNNQVNDSLIISSIRFIDNSKFHSLSFSKQLTRENNKNPAMEFDILPVMVNSPMRIQIIISKIYTDSSVARHLAAFTPMPGSIEAKGFERTTIEWEEKVLDSVLTDYPDAASTFTFLIPDSLEEGAYFARILVASDKIAKVTEPELFYIFPDYFPDVKTIKDAIEILSYLTYPSEYEAFEESSDSLLRENFEKFWLKLSDGNYRVAKKKIAEYFRRVTEANLLFSSYKPGWKTDLGMMYILMGYPAQVNWLPTSMTWYYYSRKSSYLVPFHFKPIRNNGEIIGYMLNRNNYYENLWEDYRRLWEN